VVCGIRAWVDIAWFAKDRCTWFTDVLGLTNAVDYGHGRQVRWHIVVTHCVADFSSAKEWTGIQSIIMIVTKRMCKESVEKRYYISSLKCSA